MMMSSIKLKEIVQLHSHGNQMYRYGQLIAARDTYVEVLKLIRSYDDLTHSTNQKETKMETNIQVDSNIMCDNDNEIDACDDNGDIKSGLSHNVFDDEDLYYQSLPNDMFSIRPIQDEMNAKYMIFSGAIRLDTTAITYNMELLTAVTVFNLALVFHVEGLKVMDDTDDPMNNVGIMKALRLYNQASILLSSLHKEDDDEEC